MAIELEGIAPASGGEASPGKLTAWNSETMDSRDTQSSSPNDAISLVTTPTTLNYGRIQVLLIVSLLPFSCGIGDFCCALFSFSSPDMHPLVELVPVITSR
ncbi:hypothetical protein NC651_031345 [Populus alba x Populus x berolinensis]|nr:hypothetical protein NC651_031345 [Populus alba x Populus x berolinensis]